ncbi:MAG: M55 family metallopeptidase [Cellulosilyticaceae bacterium]
MKKQLIIIADMEGASGIFEDNRKAMIHGSAEWEAYGREHITSDVLAVCDAANEFGIDEILIYDGHFAGNPEYNISEEKLPSNARFFDTPDRCFYWRRIRGQAEWNPFGVITVGQHSRYGEKDAYFPHTIQSPPLKKFRVNDIHIAEIGMGVLSFSGVKYIANIGCKASMKEALELSDTVTTISVKDKSCGWEPTVSEAYTIIKDGVLTALKGSAHKKAVTLKAPFKFSLSLVEGYYYEIPNEITWKGKFEGNTAFWDAPDIEIGLEIFNYVRELIVKVDKRL